MRTVKLCQVDTMIWRPLGVAYLNPDFIAAVEAHPCNHEHTLVTVSGGRCFAIEGAPEAVLKAIAA